MRFVPLKNGEQQSVLSPHWARQGFVKARIPARAGEPFADETYTILGASVQVAKRSELHTFAVIPQRWVVERSFAWLEKCRRLWKNCERKLNTSLQFVSLAFLALLMKRS